MSGQAGAIVRGDGMREGLKEAGEDFFWPSSVRLTLVGRSSDQDCEEELGMYLESETRQNRKRKAWAEEMDERDDKVQRRPPRKAAGASEMGAGGGSSSSSHLSPGWQVNDLEIDLAGELSMNEALLSLPSLTVFKQEAPSPTGAAGAPSPPRRAWPPRRAPDDRQMSEEMAVEGEERQLAPALLAGPHGGGQEMQCQQPMQPQLMQLNSYGALPAENKAGGGLLVCSPSGSLDGFLHSPPAARATVGCADSSFRDDLRFQYVLAAATSIAMRSSEETLTYLNQGQPYEIKLKKLGDLSHYKGKILKSLIKICFHERRLQYMEREQIAQWHSERPGERIVEVDVPLSYGLIRVHQPGEQHSLHCVEVLWDPTKDAGVYIKVNCISTEFTAKKHGGEKGVPFRVQVETFLPTHDTDHRLHAAACQIKVFKLKGADRKHKQDREKVARRPRGDVDRYQPSCEATVLTTLPNDAIMPPSLISTSPSSSPELWLKLYGTRTKLTVQYNNKPLSLRHFGEPTGRVSAVAPKPCSTLVTQAAQPSLLVAGTQVQQLGSYCQDGDVKAVPPCRSPGSVPPDHAPEGGGLPAAATHAETQAWLAGQRFGRHRDTLANFCGADLLRLSRDDLIQICDLADGIRLFNALHAKRIEPRLTLYVCAGADGAYSAVYLHGCGAAELAGKLRQLLPAPASKPEGGDSVLVSGPGGARVFLTDELVRHLPDNSTYRLQRQEATLLLSPTQH